MSHPPASSPLPTLLSTHARTLSTYRHALTHAEAQLSALQNTITSLRSSLAESRASEAAWKRRVQELDRLHRVQALELQAAKRGQREAGQELARVRVELEDLRLGVKRVRRQTTTMAIGAGMGEREVQTEELEEWERLEEDETRVVKEWAQAEGVAQVCCTCGAARAVRGLFEPPRPNRGFEDGGGYVEEDEPVGNRPKGWAWGERWASEEREKRRLLKEKLKATRERVDGLRERAEEQRGEGGWRGWASGGGGADGGGAPTYTSRVV